MNDSADLAQCLLDFTSADLREVQWEALVVTAQSRWCI